MFVGYRSVILGTARRLGLLGIFSQFFVFATTLVNLMKGNTILICPLLMMNSGWVCAGFLPCHINILPFLINKNFMSNYFETRQISTAWLKL
jgi:hypothetical protein